MFFGVLQPLCLRKDPNLGRFGLEVFVCDSEQADETGNQLFIVQMPLVAYISCNDAVRGKKADDISRCFGVVLWHLDQIVNPPLKPVAVQALSKKKRILSQDGVVHREAFRIWTDFERRQREGDDVGCPSFIVSVGRLVVRAHSIEVEVEHLESNCRYSGLS